jgi:hypothetical protein
MVRADYCGDGVGHTHNGTQINIYDRLGIQKPDVIPAMQFEAGWGINGAQCIHHVRWPEGLDYVRKICPQKLESKEQLCSTATQQLNPQALIFNDSKLPELSLNP